MPELPELPELPALFDPRDPATIEDPYPAYARLRAAGSAWRSAAGFWIVPRRVDVARLLRDRSMSSAQPGGEPGAPVGTLAEHGRWVMVASDPPDHGRRRGAVQPHFLPTAIRDLAPAIGHHVDACLDALFAAAPDHQRAGGTVDFVTHVGSVVPVLTITSLLGLPAADAPRILAWTAAFTDGLEPWGDDEAAARAGTALDDMSAYLRPHLESRRTGSSGSADLLGVLAADPDLNDDEKLQNALLLLNAGLDTSADLLANLVAALANRPDIWAEIVADPDTLGPLAVEESLRFESPVQFSMRRTVDAVVLADVTIPAGDPVLLALGSANRDPEVFPEPDRFVLRRSIKHLGFGGGAHLCLGAPLARLEATSVIAALARRLPSLTLAAPAPWRPRSFFRGRAAVPLHLP